MTKKKWGCEYYLYASDEGERFSGGITSNEDEDFDKFVQFLLKEIEKSIKYLVAKNKNRKIVLTLDFTGDEHERKIN